MPFLARGLSAVLLLVAAYAGPVAAGVSVAPQTAAAGSTVDLVLSVSTEKAGVATTKVELVFPAVHDVTAADAPLHQGWTSTVDQLGGAVNEVTWEGGRIEGSATEAFDLTVTLPGDTDTLLLKARQTYSDGDVVNWIDNQQPGKPAREHPAPVIHLTGAVTRPTNTTSSPAVTVTANSQTKAKKANGGVGQAGLVFIVVGVFIIATVFMRARGRGVGKR